MASSQAQEPDPFRSRAGYLAALTRCYNGARELLPTNPTPDQVTQTQDKLSERYYAYLESHHACVATYPEREDELNASHKQCKQQHQDVLAALQAYLDSLTPQVMDSRSLISRVSTMQSKSRASTKRTKSKAPTRVGRSSASQVSRAGSERLAEARIQAQLAKKRMEQMQTLQEIERRKQETHQDIERRRQETKQEIERRKQEAEQEMERERRRIEDETELKRQSIALEQLQAEVSIREREQVRSELGSDYESSDEEVDVTKQPQESATRSNLQEHLGLNVKPQFLNEKRQEEAMQRVLEQMTVKEAKELQEARARPSTFTSRYPFTAKPPPSTAAFATEGYTPPTYYPGLQAQAHPSTNAPPQASIHRYLLTQVLVAPYSRCRCRAQSSWNSTATQRITDPS